MASQKPLRGEDPKASGLNDLQWPRRLRSREIKTVYYVHGRIREGSGEGLIVEAHRIRGENRPATFGFEVDDAVQTLDKPL